MSRGLQTKRWLRTAIAATCILLPSFAATETASAGDDPPAVQQYIEGIPTGAGSVPSATGQGAGALSAEVRRKLMLQGGKDTVALTAIATGSTSAQSSGATDPLVLEVVAAALAASLLAAGLWRGALRRRRLE